MSLLGSAGFDLYSSDPEHLTNQLSALASPILSPLSAALDDDSSIHLLDLTASGNPISSENGAVLTRSRSSTDANVSAPALRVPIALDTTTSSAETTHQTDTDPVKPTLYRSQSHSPSGCDVHILEPDLTCIGLSDENAELWGLKIVKLVAFPDLVPGTPSFLNARRPSMETPDIASVTILGVDIDSPTDLSCSLDSGEQYDSESDTVSSRSDDITRVGDSPIDEGLHDSSESPVFNMEESPAWEGDDQGGPLGPDEYIDHDAHVDVGKRTARPSLRHLFTDRTYRQDLPKPRIRERSASQVTLPPSPLVPFFSFTRTLEGSSLTGPVALLASLFPPNERHMVMCSGELDVLDSRAASPTNHARDVVEDQDYASGDEQVEPQGTSKCLQIDLRKFGLGTYLLC
ncbi:hypothetical protein EW026_g5527 [Hermanssonia centrifuga]|uniref:Uncharacterized protein n=1 Tax=Hermanssonia centrifuga TaxID=98765 RepID=A0A4S4KDU4_9APHY|nr:hypothetical protein EW026_g5527 [Hermanssonia centrifuga]